MKEEIRKIIQNQETYKWLVLLNVCFGEFIVAVDARIIAVSLPTIALALKTDLVTIQWTTISYFLVLIGLTLFLGKLGDMIGRKYLYTGGFALFTISSAFCGISASVGQLIFFRIVQAIGGALIASNGQAIVASTFTSGDRGKALGFSSMSFHTGSLLGPSLGGFIIDSIGWRWMFYVNLPVGIAATIMAYFILREPVTKKVERHFDIPGALLLIVTLVSFLFALNQGSNYGWSSPIIVGLLGLSAVSMGVFILVELKVTEPILYLNLFRVRAFTAANSSLLLITLAQGAVSFLLPFYLQGVLSYSATHVGLIIMWSSVATVIFAPIGGRLSDRFGSRTLCTFGSFLIFVAQFLIGTLSQSSTYVQIISYLILSGIGWGLFNSPNNNAIFSSVPKERVGVASGMLLTISNIGRSTGIALSGALFAGILFQHNIKLTKGMDYSHWSLNPIPFVTAFQQSFLVAAGLTFLAIVFSAVRGKKMASPK